ANSRARRRALRALLREAPPAAPRDLLVVKIVFLVVVVVVIIIVVIVVRLGLERGNEIRHLDGGAGAVTPLFFSAHTRLFFVFGGEHAVSNRDAGLERDAADGRGAFVADHFE